MTLSWDLAWKAGTIIMVLSIMYARINFLENDNARLHQQLDKVTLDQQWTERHMLGKFGEQ